MIQVDFVNVHHLNYPQMNLLGKEKKNEVLKRIFLIFKNKPRVCLDESVIDSSIVLLWFWCCWWIVGGDDDEELTGCISSVLLLVKTNDLSLFCLIEKGVASDSLNSIISGVAKGTLTWAALRRLYKWNFISSVTVNFGAISFIRRRVVND